MAPLLTLHILTGRTGHQARHPSVDNAYFVGASAHPGTGVPIALAGTSDFSIAPIITDPKLTYVSCAGSKLCLETVCKDLGVPLPPSYQAKGHKANSWLDAREGQRIYYILEEWTSTILLLLLGIILGISLVYGRL